MGKLGRAACIFTPMALTVASFVCLILIEMAGWNHSSTGLNQLYFFEANFTNLDVASATTADNTTELTDVLELLEESSSLSDVYQIHLWNYCTTNNTNVTDCTAKKANFVFNPVTVWGLDAVSSSASTTTSSSSAVASEEAALESDTKAIEEEVFGDAAADALQAYTKVAKLMFIAYEVSFWTTLATIVCGVLALFSRWGSLLTWFFSVVSSIFTIIAVLTSTVLFGVLVTALDKILSPYGITLTLGHRALLVTWLAVVFSWAATLFWLFSVCCCSGRSNPHHRSNKGGLWTAEAKGQDYGGPLLPPAYGHGRGVRVEKTGGGYERVGAGASPFFGSQEIHGDQVPLHDYAQPMGAYDADPHQTTGHVRQQPSVGYEPFRHA